MHEMVQWSGVPASKKPVPRASPLNGFLPANFAASCALVINQVYFRECNIPEYIDYLIKFKEYVDDGKVPSQNWKEVRSFLELEYFNAENLH